MYLYYALVKVAIGRQKLKALFFEITTITITKTTSTIFTSHFVFRLK